jgi:hypothetical protein
MNQKAIEVQGIVHRYGQVTALDGISFSVEPGEVFGFLSFLSRFIPGEGLPMVVVYDPGRSKILRSLVGGDDLQVILVDSQDEVAEVLSSRVGTLLGITAPANLDQQVSAGQEIMMPGVLMHWSERESGEALAGAFTGLLHQVSRAEVQIEIAQEPVYPPRAGFGRTIFVVQLVGLMILLVGIMLAPLLLVEEKEAHTLEALLVSPARASQIINGKGLVGFLYGAGMTALALLINSYMVVDWGQAILGIVCGLIFAVSIGLLIGAISNNPTTVSLWSAIIFFFLVVGGLASMFVGDNMPVVKGFLNWFPSGAMMAMIRQSMSAPAPPWVFISQGAFLLLLSAGFYTLACRRLSQ